MNDPHPHSFKIEIDRDGLRKYLMHSWYRSWVLALGFLGGLFGLISPIGRIENGRVEGVGHVVFLLFLGILVGVLISTVIATLLYFMFSHSKAKRISESQALEVEGPFLHVSQNSDSVKQDRKIHFRAVTDFSLIEDKRMEKYGIQALHMNTTSGSQTGFIRVDGVKEGNKIRDILAEIDSIRENHEA
mgnify:CR=1 FL=1